MDHVTVTGHHNTESPMEETNIENTNINGKAQEEKSEPPYEKLKCSITVKDFLVESQTDQDIELRSSSCGRGVRANRIVLAAVSPFFKMCLADAVPENGLLTVTITDCCYESLTYVMQYIHNGCVTTADQAMKDKVENLISRLQIGDFSISRLEKIEPLVKCEPSWEPEFNAVDNYYNYINKINQHNQSQTLRRKKKLENEWKSQVISSLYKDDAEEDGMEDEDFVDDGEEEDYYSDEGEEEVEYERKPKSKPKSGSSGKKYGCKSCGSKFSSQERLDSHIERKHSTERLKCEHCPKTFSRASDKRVHEEVHSKPYKCDQCEASFGRKSNLIGHLRMHRGERPYMCDICGKSFPMQSSVTTHKRQSHPTGVKPWVCEFCERRFVSKSQLELHRRVHTGEKPWVCDTCGKGFAQKQNMIDHKRVHSDKMEYNCHTCGQQFKWKLQLERHMMDHTGMRPFPCDQCNLAFKCSNGLKSHKLSVHSDMKHFVCQHCGSGFSTSSGVSRHQKNNRCSGLKALASNDKERQDTPAVVVGVTPQVQPAGSLGVKQEAREVGGGQGEGDGRYSRESRDTMIQSMHYLQNIAAANYPLSLAMHRHQEIDRQSGQLGSNQHLAPPANYRPL